MAERFLRAMPGSRFEITSASIAATQVHPVAIKAMAESGVDLSEHTSKDPYYAATIIAIVLGL